MSRFIAIDGRGGSGKTYLSRKLGQVLGASTFHLVDFGNDFEPFVGIPALIDALEKAEGECIIFEGVGVFDERFDRFDAFRILVDTPSETRKARAAARDVARDERTEEDWRRIYGIWKEAEDAYFIDILEAKADFVVGHDTDASVSQVVDAIRM